MCNIERYKDTLCIEYAFIFIYIPLHIHLKEKRNFFHLKKNSKEIKLELV